MERTIGHGCTLTVSPAEIPGLNLTVLVKDADTGERHHWSRTIDATLWFEYRVPSAIFDQFVAEAKARFDAVFGQARTPKRRLV